MLFSTVIWIVNAFSMVLFVYCILSWFPQRGIVGTLRNGLGTVIEPLLKPIQKIMPATGGIDFSPLILMFLLQILVRCIAGFF